MKHFSKTPIGYLRITGILEGISYLLLLFIAMPLKYWAGIPEAVKAVGWVHGLLFVIYAVLILYVQIEVKWKFKYSVLAFIASLLPFGTFLIDKTLQKEEVKN